MLPFIEIETRKNPKYSVIWLHGLGADGSDFASIAHELDFPARFIFPHAPMQSVSINGGYVMRAWYDIYALDLSRGEDEKGIIQSQKHIEALIDNEMDRGILPSNVVLAGFSQGGAIALYAGLGFPQKLAGILALSTYLPLSASFKASQANADIPIFMAHGIEDQVIQMPIAQKSRDHLTKMGHNVSWHAYAMAHSVCPEEIKDISLWLKSLP